MASSTSIAPSARDQVHLGGPIQPSTSTSASASSSTSAAGASSTMGPGGGGGGSALGLTSSHHTAGGGTATASTRAGETATGGSSALHRQRRRSSGTSTSSSAVAAGQPTSHSHHQHQQHHRSSSSSTHLHPSHSHLHHQTHHQNRRRGGGGGAGRGSSSPSTTAKLSSSATASAAASGDAHSSIASPPSSSSSFGSGSGSGSGTRLFRPPDPPMGTDSDLDAHTSSNSGGLDPRSISGNSSTGFPRPTLAQHDFDNEDRSYPFSQDDARAVHPTTDSATSATSSVGGVGSGPVLSLAFPAVKDVRGVEGVSGLWHVFTRCKAHLADGDRLENISWRLWYQACAQRAQVQVHGSASGIEYGTLAGEGVARETEQGGGGNAHREVTAGGMVAVGGVYGSPVDVDDEDDSDDFEDEDEDEEKTSAGGTDERLEIILPKEIRKRTSTPDLHPSRSRRASRHAPARTIRRPSSSASTTASGGLDSGSASGGRRRSSAGSSASRRSISVANRTGADSARGGPSHTATPIVIAPPAASESTSSPPAPTPKASSYPTATPSQSFVNTRPSLSSMRTRSSLAAPAVAAAFHVRRLDRSFGEVLTDVFKTSSLQDLSTAAKRVEAVGATTATTPAVPQLHPATRVSKRPNPALHTISQETTPMPSPRRERSAGPELRVVEPTPAPSRVGSLGTTTPVASAMASSPTRSASPRSVSFGDGAIKTVYSPQEEIQDPMDQHAAGDTALSETALAQLDQQQQQEQGTMQPKKSKKSIFFIHSGGDKRQQRQGSMSGSDFSTETASTLGEPSLKRPNNGGESVKQMATSPLARSSETRRPSQDKEVVNTAHVADPPAPRSPPHDAAVVVGEQPERPANLHRTSSKRSNTGSTAMKRTTSGPGHGHGHKHAPPKRTGTSAAHMAGKFNGEKARAAAAIAARLQAQQEKERAEQAEKRQKLSLAKRQRSEPNLVQQTDDSDAWSSETEETPAEANGGGGGGGGGYLSFGKKTKTPPMDLAKAADEAQRQRELFAKRAIFGSASVEPSSGGSGAGGLSTSHGSRGLLSNLFNSQRDVIRRGESMVNLEEQRPMPTVAPASSLSFNRSKSVVAMPMTTGVSVGREGLIESEMPQVDRSPEALKTSRSRLRLPPKPGDMDLSPDSSPDNNAEGIDKTEAIRRLEALTNKRDEPELTRTTSHPLPLPLPAFQHLEPALPQTPTTRRRQMLATELPEDLRLNLIWERQSRLPKLPPKRAMTLRPSASHHDLPDHTRRLSTGAVPSQDPPHPASSGMTRQYSNPVDRIERSPEKPTATTQAAAEPPRRRAPNLLSGGALLRPLTTAVRKPDPPQESSVRERAGGGGGEHSNARPTDQFASRRSKSTVDMTQFGQHQTRNGGGGGGFVVDGDADSPSAATTTDDSDSPMFMRRRTDGIMGFGNNEWRPPPVARQKSLKEREGELSSSFRSHGW